VVLTIFFTFASAFDCAGQIRRTVNGKTTALKRWGEKGRKKQIIIRKEKNINTNLYGRIIYSP
jgi:hypothetical protein